MPVLQGKQSPERTIFFYRGEHLNAVRSGKWKLHLRYYDHSKGGYSKEENWVTPETPLLFDLNVDPSEKYNLADKHIKIVAELKAVAENYKQEIKKNGENKELLDWFINDWPTAPRK